MGGNRSTRNIENLHSSFQGGEQNGKFLKSLDVKNILVEALKTILYRQVVPKANPSKPDRNYFNNACFWRHALSRQHFPSARVVLNHFYLSEWLPFSPGRYFTDSAKFERQRAIQAISQNRDEYLPNGKASMVRGGIGATRLAEKPINGRTIYFLGASSTGVAHQGIPIALPSEEYCKVMEIISERGSCQVKLVGSLQTMTENHPSLDFDKNIPRYCLLAEEVTIEKPSTCKKLLTTVAIMFTTIEATDHYDYTNKSWTFYSFNPDPRKSDERSHAVEWLLDYAKRYSHNNPIILSDFDEHYDFPCRVEFPISDIVRGIVDWKALRVYKQRLPAGDTFIENIIEKYEDNTVIGDQFNVHGTGNTIVNRSTIQNAFNKVKGDYDEETAEALKLVEEEINKSGNKEAAENFEAFSEELSKPEPKKSLLKTLWEGTLSALPTLAQLSSVANLIVRLFC